MIILSSAAFAKAAATVFDKYTVLTSVPGLQSGTVDTNKTDLSTYLGSLYKFGVAAAAGLAVIMVIWGGIEYITAVAGEGKSGGKERITSAILGLLLALGSYIILNTINPDLLSLKFTLPNAVIKMDPIDLKNYQAGYTVNEDGTITYAGEPTGSVTDTPIGSKPATASAVQNDDGTYSFTTNNPGLDTDGINPPPFSDPNWYDGNGNLKHGYQNGTSVPGLDANSDYYVAVPNNTIPLRTPVTIINNTTGKSVEGIVGDHQGAAAVATTPYTEMSFAAARDTGGWTGKGNSMQNHNYTYIYHTQ
ncbi:MAG: hypothetical protein V4438_03545 [Patescibacteria group bacterium]